LVIPEILWRRFRTARRLTVLTGAGVSAASGVPTFRGPGGLWRNVRPEELATAAAFRRDPVLVWEWYAWRRRTIAACEPNAAHRVIAEWSHRHRFDAHPDEPWCTVITQNVDDLHVRAGTKDVIRLHGSIWQLQCWSACGQGKWRDERPALPDTTPVCPRCGGLARPAVVWFGEPLDPADIAAARRACDCDLFLTVGTSAVVHPAAGLVSEAKQRGAFTVEVNPDDTPASAVVDLSLRGAAEIILPQLSRLD
jgi:NAD-dependent deacetylase